MLGTTQYSKYIQAIEWTLFVGLCGVSMVFMYGVLDKFFSGKTGFAQSEERIKEIPTIVICFSKSRKTEYEYGLDFEIEYAIAVNGYDSNSTLLREGEKLIRYGEAIWLEKLTTHFMGNCYKLTSEFITNKHGFQSATDINFYFNGSIPPEDLPEKVIMHVSSEKNSYGIVTNEWMNGIVWKTFIKKGMDKFVDLKPEQHNFLKSKTKCSNESFYDCYGRLLAAMLNGSSSQCSLFSLPSLPICKSNKTKEEKKFFHNSVKKVYRQCRTKKLCNKLEYHGEDVFYEDLDKDDNKTFGFGYQITSNSTTLFEEYLIYDIISVIGAVGGTLGMCIGFSFTGLISSLIKILENIIIIINEKYTNQNVSKSKLVRNIIETETFQIGKDLNNCNNEKYLKENTIKNLVSCEYTKEEFEQLKTKMRSLEKLVEANSRKLEAI